MLALPVALTACGAPVPLQAIGSSPRTTRPAADDDAIAEFARIAELEARYRLALAAFDRGAYELAADQFSVVLLDVPQTPAGDRLRHLLIQHIGWSLLGRYDVTRDVASLDRGEGILERYLDKHELLLPDNHGERTDIYELLGEYGLRREDQQPTNVNAQLRALVYETHANIEGSLPQTGRINIDRMVREIEVDTRKWAKLNDPGTQRYFRGDGSTGESLFAKSGDLFNPARVLVRGWARKGETSANSHARRRVYELLRSAHSTLEACYDLALGRGASLVERVHLELRWDDDGLSRVEALARSSDVDPDFQACITHALTTRDESEGEGEAVAELHLTFFVQPPRAPSRGDVDYGYLGTTAPLPSGDITADAKPDDASN